MSDYYTQRTPERPGHKAGYPDYADTGSTGTWFWVAIVLVAIVAVVAVGLSSGGSDTAPEGATIELAPAQPDAATPAPAPAPEAVPAPAN